MLLSESINHQGVLFMKLKVCFTTILTLSILFFSQTMVLGQTTLKPTPKITLNNEEIPKFGLSTAAPASISKKANQLYQNLGWKNIAIDMLYSEIPLYYSNPNENNFDLINKESKSIGLSGAKSFIDGTQYFAREYYTVENYNTPYEVMFNILTNDQGIIKMAWFHVTSGIFQCEGYRFINKEWILPANASKQNIEQLILNDYDKNTVKPIDAIAKTGYFADFKVDDVRNKTFSALFKASAFKPKNMQFSLLNHDIITDVLTLDGSNKTLKIYQSKFFSSKEIKKIESILNQSRNDENKLALNLSQSYFSEHKYSLLIDEKKVYYYIDFFVYPLSDNNKNKEFITWLVVKPAKINKQGVLDRLIYNSTVSKDTIESDIKTYYKHK